MLEWRVVEDIYTSHYSHDLKVSYLRLSCLVYLIPSLSTRTKYCILSKKAGCNCTERGNKAEILCLDYYNS